MGPATAWQSPRILHFKNRAFIEQMRPSESMIRIANSTQILRIPGVDGGVRTD